jgi:hypothetical protein
MTMDTQHIEIDRAKAKELYRKYREHAHYAKPIDHEVMRAYQLLSQGRLVIKAIESIVKAGLKTEGVDAGFPKLALVRADAPSCKVQLSKDGSGYMHAGDIEPKWRGWRSGSSGVVQSKNVFWFPAGTFTGAADRYRGEAVAPLVPIHLRPKRGIENYHVLFEAEWTHIAPVDPFLVRRIGKSDLWAVCAMWELTEVERAVLSSRINA